ncbi:MAG: protein kinase [bacterium]
MGSDQRITEPGQRRSTTSEERVGLTPLPGPHSISEVEVRIPEALTLGTSDEDVVFTDRAGLTPTTEQPQIRRQRRVSEDVNTGVWEGQRRARSTTADVQMRTIADRYRVLERIATGGMARIYKVRHINLGKIFALKVVDRQSEAAKRLEQLFFREAQVAGVMDHPNLVGVTDFGLDDELGAYIVMEYLKGETLHARLRGLGDNRQPLHLSAALEIGLQIAEALHYMHSQNVIHCDIKSENIFLCQQQKEHRQRILVKLIDFGLSRSRSSGLQLAKAEVGGTPEYMAPELIKGRAPQPSMDIYSLGVLFYEMLTRRLPFTGALEEVVAAQLMHEPIPPSQMLGEPLDERVEAFIMKALAKDPTQRSESMGQVIFELRTLMEMLDFRDGRTSRGKPGPRAADPPLAHFRGFFDRSPCPMFQLDPQARIITANRAFRHFVGVSKREMVGRLIDTTRLAYVYPNVVADIADLVGSKHRTPVQRILSFTQPDGKRIPMMCWLTADVDDGQVARIYGLVHPLES